MWTARDCFSWTVDHLILIKSEWTQARRAGKLQDIIFCKLWTQCPGCCERSSDEQIMFSTYGEWKHVYFTVNMCLRKGTTPCQSSFECMCAYVFACLWWYVNDLCECIDGRKKETVSMTFALFPFFFFLLATSFNWLTYLFFWSQFLDWSHFSHVGLGCRNHPRDQNLLLSCTGSCLEAHQHP